MASRSATVDRLRAVPLFSRCSTRDLRIVARHLEVVNGDAGATVVSEGEHGDAFFIVLEGSATVLRGGRKAGSLGPGDHFGELALLDPAPRAASVRADTPVVLGALGHRMFKVLLRDMPTLSAGLLAAMASDLRLAHRNQAV